MKRTLLLLLLGPLAGLAQTNRPTTIADADKLVGLSTFWSEAKYNFAYFDKAKIDWDSAYRAFIPQVLATKNDFEYYRTMERFCALLKDGHTSVWAPASFYPFSTYVPFRWVIIGQKPHVSMVLKGLSDNVPVGSELLTINGLPAQTYLKEQIFPYIAASAPHQRWNSALFAIWSATNDTTTTYPMTFRTPDGRTVAFASRLFSQRERDGSVWLNGAGVAQPKQRPLSMLTMLPGDIARVELNSFDNQKIVTEFEAMLPQLRQAKGIIIDLRQNGGGSSGVGAAILNHFTTQKTMTGSAWRTREHQAAYKAWGSFSVAKPDSFQLKNSSEYRKMHQTALGNHWFQGQKMTFPNNAPEPRLLMPTVVVAGNNTGSAAEDFLIIVRQLTDRKIPVIGQPSFGSTGQPLLFKLPGGGTARICTKRDTYADGRDFVGIGVLPDVLVNPAVADLQQGRDATLERAVAELKGR
jgi:carboxyl-terminal processing protease